MLLVVKLVRRLSSHTESKRTTYDTDGSRGIDKQMDTEANKKTGKQGILNRKCVHGKDENSNAALVELRFVVK